MLLIVVCQTSCARSRRSLSRQPVQDTASSSSILIQADHRRTPLYTGRPVRLPSLPQHAPDHQRALSLRRRAQTRRFPCARAPRTRGLQPRVRQASIHVLVLVRLCDAVGHRRRDGVLLIELAARPLHEGAHGAPLHGHAAQQLAHRCARRGYRVDALLGHSHGFPGRQKVPRRILDRHYGHCDVRYDPGAECHDCIDVCGILLGRLRVRL